VHLLKDQCSKTLRIEKKRRIDECGEKEEKEDDRQKWGSERLTNCSVISLTRNLNWGRNWGNGPIVKFKKRLKRGDLPCFNGRNEQRSRSWEKEKRNRWGGGRTPREEFEKGTSSAIGGV